MLAANSAKPRNNVPLTVHWLGPGRMLASRGLAVLESGDLGRSWAELCTVEAGIGRVLASSRLSRRLFRAGIHHVQPIDGGRLVIVANNFIQTFDVRNGTFLPPCPLTGSRPLTLCATPSGCAFGEYRNNPERGDIHVFASDDGVTWERALGFAGVRHIHSVQWDCYEGKLWITTGDEDRECAIWRSSPTWGDLERVVGGTQQHRAVQLVFTESAVYFGTDAPSERNGIYRMDRTSRRVTEVASVTGPVFYGCKVGRKIFFATVCEPTDKSRNRVATVWGSDEADCEFRLVLSYVKDIWPMRLFQYGQVKFPAGDNAGPLLWLTPFATALDQRSLAYDVEELLQRP